MKIYFAAVGHLGIVERIRRERDVFEPLFSYYDLSDQCKIPFRKEVYKWLIKNENLFCWKSGRDISEEIKPV